MKEMPRKKLLFLYMSVLVLFFQAEIIISTMAQDSNEDNLIPAWYKTSVDWWLAEKITDDEIINSIEFLWHKGIIKIDNKIETSPNFDSNFIPISYEDQKKLISDLKQKFGFWSKGSISDEEVTNTIIKLIQKRIINNLDFTETKLSAAIIDVLDDSFPNRLAQQKIQQFLEKGGYTVDVFSAKDTTVEFYKKLPSTDYNFIYIRTHSLVVPELNNATFLFSGEEYNIDKYLSEQLSGQLARGTPIYEVERQDQDNQSENQEMYFMFGSIFVDEQMEGNFPNSIIVIGGCESAKNLDMANSFVSRGASSVIGWTDPILVGENDRAMVTLFEEIFVNKLEISNSVDIVMEKYGSNLQYDSKLRYLHP